MNAHRSLSRKDVVKHGPQNIALMVASEFLRAAGRADHPALAEAAVRRARELMGILETLPLPVDAARRLQPIYRRCASRRLFAGERPLAAQIRRGGLELGDEFTRASALMAAATRQTA
jgi:hypothetical protein